MPELNDVLTVDLENALENASDHLDLYTRVRLIAKCGVKDGIEAKVLQAMLKDRYGK